MSGDNDSGASCIRGRGRRADDTALGDIDGGFTTVGTKNAIVS